MTSLVLIANLHAATYYVDMPVHIDPPPPSLQVSTVSQGVIAAIEHDDVSAIASSHSNFWCKLQDNTFYVHFEASTSAWPTSFPSTVTCSYGGDSLVATVHQIPGAHPLYLHSDVQSTMEAVLFKRPDSMVHKSYVLPTDDYELSSYSATLTDTYCRVVELSAGHGLQVYSGPAGGMGSGTCSLNLSDGDSVNVSLKVNPR